MFDVMSHETDPREIENSWMNQSALFERIQKSGGMQKYTEALPLKEAFQREVGAACCIDEGTPEGQMRIAGAGILHPGGVEVVAELMAKAGVTEVTSHAGCGAAELAYEKSYGRKAKSQKEVDVYATRWVEKLAKQLGVPARHISKDSIAKNRPPESHDARSIYLDGTGRLNPAALGDRLPKGFVISVALMDKEHALQNIEVAISIALGSHGFGNRFTKEHPLVLIPVGAEKNGFDLESLTALAESIIQKYAHRIRIDGFTAPDTASVAEAA